MIYSTYRWLYAVAAAGMLAMACPVEAASSNLKVTDLRCEYRTNPQGIDQMNPRLSWKLESARIGQRQTAYQILVASSKTALMDNRGDLWDSGRIDSDQSVNVPYAGAPLTSRQECYWKVKVWDSEGDVSYWSNMGTWSMGLLNPEDWQAEYISYRDTSKVHTNTSLLHLPVPRQYRKEFDSSKSVRRATLYATALGIFEMHLNGQRVGDHYFSPGWTDYRKRAYYETHDVTSLLKNGDNAVAAWVADGWYSGYVGFGLLTGMGTEMNGRYTYGKTPAFMAQLEIEFMDGSRKTVVTDDSWKVTDQGPIWQADLLMGESFDARNFLFGWSEPGFDDSKWEQAVAASENGPVKANFYQDYNPPAGRQVEKFPKEIDLGFQRPERLEAFPGVPVRVIEEIKPVKITSPQRYVYIFDLGQNISGFIRLKLRGAEGQRVRLRYGEMLHEDGNLMVENLRKARATDYYVLSGSASGEVWMPRFTYHGFRYVEATGLPGRPDDDTLTGIVVHSDTPMTSSFECSDPMVNRLYRNIVWTQRGNFVDLPTDCPQRDERMGWTGDAQIYIRTATYNADVSAFFTKWMRELMDAQRPSGAFPGYAPFPFQTGWDFGTAWADAGVICPWTIYKVYDDTNIVNECWDGMTRFMDWRKRTSKDNLGVVHGNDWGDWLSINEKTPLDYIDTIYFAYSTKLMAEMAEGTDRDSEAAEYRDLFSKIKTAFNRKYVRASGELTVNTQTAYALALHVGLIDESVRQAAADRLAQKIVENGHRMTTGFLGTKHLLPVLTANGHNDLAVRLLQSREYPSWGYEIDNGATTIWERWNSYTREDGFADVGMNSFSHYSFGAVGEWMFSTLAGIDCEGTGFKKIIIHPNPPSLESNPTQRPINWVKASYDSVHGKIESNWQNEADSFKLDVVIPPNTTARVYLPADDNDQVREGWSRIDKAKGVGIVGFEGDRLVLSVVAGKYNFKVQKK